MKACLVFPFSSIHRFIEFRDRARCSLGVIMLIRTIKHSTGWDQNFEFYKCSKQWMVNGKFVGGEVPKSKMFVKKK